MNLRIKMNKELLDKLKKIKKLVKTLYNRNSCVRV